MCSKNEFNLLQIALLQAQIMEARSASRKNLWEREYITQEEAAFLLDITKENLLDKSMYYKPIKKGKKLYYSTEQLKRSFAEATIMPASAHSDLEVQMKFQQLTRGKTA
ncbi:hypothetical protein ACD591_09920 [Rufibacter glacialis]|uniref:Uncharacterized protein n=1 Tax=Rufibacter glacialis TaxID=1259555 RepID=A0A5M8Q9X2_9BACT|nr:hypothetical protein [Rufibacter glacialis]KAA6431913.1 hypothetical protein FOE74_17550 [Rufibacter glacialis]GGK80457.1 hypothetical protein GCM10011405_30300 [Rufibacter glacialis]